MIKNPTSNPVDERRRSIKGLLLCIALVPFILIILFIFGELALMMPSHDQPTNTRSKLLVSYGIWPYAQIPPINVEAMVKDIIQEKKQAAAPEPTIVESVLLEPPTATAVSIAMVTSTPMLQPTDTQAALPTATRRPPATATPGPTKGTPTLQPTATRTPTRMATPTSTPTATRTAVPTYPPTRTPTQEPPKPQPTATPKPPTAVPPTRTPTRRPPTATPVTPTAVLATPTSTGPKPTAVIPPTKPAVPTATPVTPTAVYVPVHPIAENDGKSVPSGSGCKASFGYLNDNPKAVDIAVGEKNYLRPEVLPAPQPQHFGVGRMFDTFQVTWTTPGAITWTLDGGSASAAWCK